ncbi:flavodoxin domain-containing protein [Globicatella sulfidifaciens]|uniref:Flavodoxin domain-containing protein n=1 Tax=Globicatella sulfidifaciens TaxID=136093 RepID=A0A7X8C2S8_9LACT|nr:flavodoxin domain-containing protein [Globicatella sulfidifaciens]NLJ17749.1 hypothetical protein [Globicatella sulfidifaciens]
MEIIVIHSSRYGSTEKYAIEISKKLRCPVVDSAQVSVEDLASYDIIILGTCLLEGQLSDAAMYEQWVKQYPDKYWALFTVGLSNPKLTDFKDILDNNFEDATIEKVELFHYRGAIQYKRLLLMESLVSKVKQKRLASIDYVPLDDDNERLLRKYGTTYDFTDKENTILLIDWVNKILRNEKELEE